MQPWMRRFARSLTLALLLLQPVADATERSRAVRAGFQHLHPCPITNARHGACRGYQVDHIVPLKCGGADRPENMQWLTVQEHAQKTAREARLCRKPRVGRN